MASVAVWDVHKYYGDNHVLKGISFDIFHGERVGLLGKNGAGKSTLFQILSGQEGYDQGSVVVTGKERVGILDQIPVYPESYTVMDVLTTAFEETKRLSNEMKRLEDRMSSDSSPELLKQYGKVQMQFEALDGYTMDHRIERVCSGLGIDSAMQQRLFHRLSGGEKTKVCLGTVILKDTDLLLLDEPTNHLDIQSVEWLEEFLTQYAGTVVVVSHDRYFLDNVVNRIIEIVDGTAHFYQGSYSFYVREKEARYMQQLAQYEQEQKKIRQLEEAARKMHEWARNADNPQMHKRAFAIEKRIERMEKTDRPQKKNAMTGTFQEKRFSGQQMIILKDACKAYDRKEVVKEVSLIVYRGERVALLGANGCGKTTLLKLMTGEEQADKGIARLGESARYAFLQQTISFDNPEYTVLDTMRYSFGIHEELARKRLAVFHFKGKDVYTPVHSLSGGEKCRLRLCMLMQEQVNLLILDEPTNHLDIASREWMEAAIADFQGTILFVSHDRYFINRFASRIWEMNNGVITDYDGTYQEYREWKLRHQTAAVKLSEQEKKAPVSYRQRDTETDDKTREIQELEGLIVEREDCLRQVKEQMEEYAFDYERLQELHTEKEGITKEIETLYKKWAALENL